jgi:hypothetical protein
MTDIRLVKIKNNIKYIRETKGCPMRLVITPLFSNYGTPM